MAAKPLRGYRRLPGSARRYLTPSGQEISRHEYEKRRIRAAGWESPREMRRFRRSEEWAAWRFKARSYDKSQDTSYSGDLMRAAYQVESMRAAGIPDTADDMTDPDGPMAQLLAAIGRRDPEWDWNVGDTPTGVKA